MVVTQRCLEQDLNPRPTDRKSNALAVALPRHQIIYNDRKQCIITDGVDLESEEQVEWYGGKKVEQKPSSDVVRRNETRLVDDLSAFADVRCTKVEHDVYITSASYRLVELYQCTPCPENGATVVLRLTLPNADRFSTTFH